jgi:hypothetical protein
MQFLAARLDHFRGCLGLGIDELIYVLPTAGELLIDGTGEHHLPGRQQLLPEASHELVGVGVQPGFEPRALDARFQLQTA